MSVSTGIVFDTATSVGTGSALQTARYVAPRRDQRPAAASMGSAHARPRHGAPRKPQADASREGGTACARGRAVHAARRGRHTHPISAASDATFLRTSARPFATEFAVAMVLGLAMGDGSGLRLVEENTHGNTRQTNRKKQQPVRGSTRRAPPPSRTDPRSASALAEMFGLMLAAKKAAAAVPKPVVYFCLLPRSRLPAAWRALPARRAPQPAGTWRARAACVYEETHTSRAITQTQLKDSDDCIVTVRLCLRAACCVLRDCAESPSSHRPRAPLPPTAHLQGRPEAGIGL